MDFSMSLDIRFNRAVDTEVDIVWPGGYTMVMNNEEIHFDFCQFGCDVDENDKALVHVFHEVPDVEEYPIMESLTKEHLLSVTKIPEVFVFTGEKGETDLKPVAVEMLSFTLEDGTAHTIMVPEQIAKAAVVCCNIE